MDLIIEKPPEEGITVLASAENEGLSLLATQADRRGRGILSVNQSQQRDQIQNHTHRGSSNRKQINNKIEDASNVS